MNFDKAHAVGWGVYYIGFSCFCFEKSEWTRSHISSLLSIHICSTNWDAKGGSSGWIRWDNWRTSCLKFMSDIFMPKQKIQKYICHLSVFVWYSKEHLLEVFHETLFITSVSLIIFDLLSKNTRTWSTLLRFTNCSGVWTGFVSELKLPKVVVRGILGYIFDNN